MTKLVLIRHGESIWNMENRFTGWVDVDLSPKGMIEAHAAGKLLKENKWVFDVAFCSMLKRAIRTLWIILDETDLMWIPIQMSWRLNEKHYGALQGLNKAETVQKYGEAQVLRWRRSYSDPPPPLLRTHSLHPDQDLRYADLSETERPSTESLKDTGERVLFYWQQVIAPKIQSGKRVMIAAHGNSLRALVKHLDHLSDDEIVGLNIPTAVPLVYELDDDLHPITHYYMGDMEAINKAIQQVANQGKGL